MPKSAFERFMDNLPANPDLLEEVAAAITRIAKSAGYNVTAEDATAHFSRPTGRTLPRPSEPGFPITSMMVGEEDKGRFNPRTTQVVGEDSGYREPPRREEITMTSAEIGEEGKPIRIDM